MTYSSDTVPGGERPSVRAQATDKVQQATQGLVGGFNRVLDMAEQHIDRVPEGGRENARRALGFARERPLLTMGGLALGALVLLNGLGRRR